jgi:hypothetical protein
MDFGEKIAGNPVNGGFSPVPQAGAGPVADM